jgi:hypothetical protein
LTYNIAKFLNYQSSTHKQESSGEGEIIPTVRGERDKITHREDDLHHQYTRQSSSCTSIEQQESLTTRRGRKEGLNEGLNESVETTEKQANDVLFDTDNTS